jgi:hypothetical protein
VVALDAHPVGHLLHRHRGVPGKDVHEHAAVVRIEMLNEDESQPGVNRNGRNEIEERLQPAGRRADSNHANGSDALLRG